MTDSISIQSICSFWQQYILFVQFTVVMLDQTQHNKFRKSHLCPLHRIVLEIKIVITKYLDQIWSFIDTQCLYVKYYTDVLNFCSSDLQIYQEVL